MLRTILNMCFLSIVYVGCYAQSETEKLIEQLEKNKIPDTINIFQSFCKIGKPAIPLLIDAIDHNLMGYVGFQDERLSTIYPIHFNYKGIEIAFIIEFIIRNGDNCICDNFYQDSCHNNPINFYQYGIIVKTIDGEPVMNFLELEDMKIIKKIYLNWWNKNKDKSLKELSEEWENNNRVLTGSSYLWK